MRGLVVRDRRAHKRIRNVKVGSFENGKVGIHFIIQHVCGQVLTGGLFVVDGRFALITTLLSVRLAVRLWVDWRSGWRSGWRSDWRSGWRSGSCPPHLVSVLHTHSPSTCPLFSRLTAFFDSTCPPTQPARLFTHFGSLPHAYLFLCTFNLPALLSPQPDRPPNLPACSRKLDPNPSVCVLVPTPPAHSPTRHIQPARLFHPNSDHLPDLLMVIVRAFSCTFTPRHRSPSPRPIICPPPWIK